MLTLLICGCSTPGSGSSPPQPVHRQSEFIGKVWMSTDASAAPGTLRVFLPDGTLLMDSCWETYRLVRWRAIDERRIEWNEDAARVEAQIEEVTGDQLRLRLQLVRDVKVEAYRPAQVPAVCPDMPR